MEVFFKVLTSKSIREISNYNAGFMEAKSL